uniref:F-box domain-containing protein n=1 Tax=Ditylenchus dipsaci TaxID=166011 RepID=A0A915DFS8_9BILA
MDNLYSIEEEIKAVSAIFPDLVNIINPKSTISINLNETTDVLVTLQSRSDPKIEIFAPAFSSRFSKKFQKKLLDICAEYPDEPNLYYLVYDEEDSDPEDVLLSFQVTPNELRAKQACSIEKLANELLIEIFEWLPPEDRLQAELVSHRWRKLTKDYSWSKYCSIFIEDFSFLRYEEDNVKLRFLTKILIPRCARFTKEIDFRELCNGRAIAKLTCLLPNLQHIILEDRHAYEAFTQITERYPTIKSVVLERLQHEDNLLDILVSCPELEFIGLLNCRHPFQNTPANFPMSPFLKRLEIENCDYTYALKLLTQVAESSIYLESLRVTELAAEKINFNQVAKYGNRLKYLSLVLNTKESWGCFQSQLHRLSKLQVLELDLRSLDCEKWPNELIKQVAKTCVELQHLTVFACKCADIKDIGALAELSELYSVKFYGLLKCRITHLFERLVAGEKLRYFHTDTTLPLKSVCKALTKCPDLTDICSGPYTSTVFAYKEVMKALDGIHDRHKPPLADDKHICWIDFGTDRREQLPTHAWARFAKKRENKVVQNAAYGSLSCSRRFACAL